MADIVFPKTAVDDDDDVVIALETARVEFERGDHSEAARWLHRAASAARKQGRPDRAGELSRIASKLAPRVQAKPDTERFERKPEPNHLLTDAEDDFGDETVVDKVVPVGLAVPPPVVQMNVKSAVEPVRSQPPRPKRTEVAQSLVEPPLLSACRVAVKREGSKLSARVLRDGEVLASDEEEAILVPMNAGVRFF